MTHEDAIDCYLRLKLVSYWQTIFSVFTWKKSNDVKLDRKERVIRKF